MTTFILNRIEQLQELALPLEPDAEQRARWQEQVIQYTSDYYPRSMYYYDFKVYQGSQSQLVSWSAGAGDIGPTLFELAGNRYALERAMSDKLGILDENELVLWRVDD